MKQILNPILLAIGGGSVIEFISSSEFEVLYKYGTQTTTMFFSMFIAWKQYKKSKNQNSSN
jgi:hypothetical protein